MNVEKINVSIDLITRVSINTVLIPTLVPISILKIDPPTPCLHSCTLGVDGMNSIEVYQVQHDFTVQYFNPISQSIYANIASNHPHPHYQYCTDGVEHRF